VKDNHTVGKQWPEMVVKKPFASIIHFYSDYSSLISGLLLFMPKDVILCT
jgi:hypothetical protein